ncbi:MAG: TolC family protein [Candidatus Obscuribacterales bacterium]|nr:TolC family protein [Candidatus Obscuribacterales bacterium]
MSPFTRQRFVGFLLLGVLTAPNSVAALAANSSTSKTFSPNFKHSLSLGTRLRIAAAKKTTPPTYTDAPPVILPAASPQVIRPVDAPTQPSLDLPIAVPSGGTKVPSEAVEGPGGPGSTVDPKERFTPKPTETIPITNTPVTSPIEPASRGESNPSGIPEQGAHTPPSTSPQDALNLRGPMGDSMSIGQAMNETLINSPRAAAVRFNLGITKAELIRATELPNPTIFMDSGYKAEFTYRYGVTIPIEPPWKLVFRILAAKKQIKQTDFEIRNALWQLRGDIRKAYTELVVAQETYETLVDLYDLSARLYEVAAKRFQAGDVPELDVLKARLLNGQNAIERDVGARRVTQARQALAILLGRTVDTQVQVPRLQPFQLRAEKIDLLPDFNKDMPKLDVLLAAAKQNRLELKVLARAIDTAKAQLKVAYGEILPNPTLGVGSSVVNGPPLDPSQIEPGSILPKNVFHGYFIQVFQPLPIFDLNQGDISKYRATIRALNSQVISQENVIQQEVSAAYQRVLAARQRISTYQEKLLNDSNEVARLARRSYEVGQSDITSTLLTQQANIQIRNQYLDAVNSYQQAFTDLEQAIGTVLQ